MPVSCRQARTALHAEPNVLLQLPSMCTTAPLRCEVQCLGMRLHFQERQMTSVCV